MGSLMKAAIFSVAVSSGMWIHAAAGVRVEEEIFGNSLGGWKKEDKRAAEYTLSGSTYRTYKPEITPTPEGGIFISLRIDHVRGWLASNDHAMLEVTVSPDGIVLSAKSSVAIQGRSISSALILGVNEAGKEITGADRAVQIGTDLVADLTARLLREKIVEAGRVSFPAALRHNYNLLYQALRDEAVPVAKPAKPDDGVVAAPEAPSAARAPDPVPAPAALEAVEASPAPTPGKAPAAPTAASAGATPAKAADATPAAASGESAKPAPQHKPLEVQPYDVQRQAEIQKP